MSTIPPLTQTDDSILTAVRSFLLTYVTPPGAEVVGDSNNRVSMPNNPYILMNHLGKPRMATNMEAVFVETVATTTLATASIYQPTKYGLQLDCVDNTPEHASGDWAQRISMLWRSAYAASYFKPLGMAPLYTDDPHHAPWANGENQWEDRWIVDVYLQVNPGVIIALDSFSTVDVGIVDVDGTIHT